jgi:hypothetical protein
MQLVDNDTVSIPSCTESITEQSMTGRFSSYPGCLRCFNHRRSTERYGSLTRDVSFPTSLSPPLISSFDPTVTHDGDDVTMDVADDTREYPCIIRVTDGKDEKFSTHVRTFR